MSQGVLHARCCGAEVWWCDLRLRFPVVFSEQLLIVSTVMQLLIVSISALLFSRSTLRFQDEESLLSCCTARTSKHVKFVVIALRHVCSTLCWGCENNSNLNDEEITFTSPVRGAACGRFTCIEVGMISLPQRAQSFHWMCEQHCGRQ